IRGVRVLTGSIQVDACGDADARLDEAVSQSTGPAEKINANDVRAGPSGPSLCPCGAPLLGHIVRYLNVVRCLNGRFCLSLLRTFGSSEDTSDQSLVSTVLAAYLTDRLRAAQQAAAYDGDASAVGAAEPCNVKH